MIMQPRDKFFSALLRVRAAADMRIGSGDAAGPAVIDAGTVIDSGAMESVRQAMMSSATVGRWDYVLDLSRVSAMDSAGLGALVSAIRTVRDVGGSVGLVTNSPDVQRILELCARNRSCHIFSGTADAVAALTRPVQPKTAA